MRLISPVVVLAEPVAEGDRRELRRLTADDVLGTDAVLVGPHRHVHRDSDRLPGLDVVQIDVRVRRAKLLEDHLILENAVQKPKLPYRTAVLGDPNVDVPGSVVARGHRDDLGTSGAEGRHQVHPVQKGDPTRENHENHDCRGEHQPLQELLRLGLGRLGLEHPSEIDVGHGLPLDVVGRTHPARGVAVRLDCGHFLCVIHLCPLLGLR